MRILGRTRALIPLCVVGIVAAIPAAAEARPASKPPNVIVVVTDDQSEAMFTRQVMPHAFRLLVDRGTRFANSVVSTSLCCPSRVALLTGQYGHNNGVLRNSYVPMRRKGHVLPRWLKRAGYRTMHVGRWLNLYEAISEDVAPGWDIWRTALHPRAYYDYRLHRNRGTRAFGSGDEDHLTAVINRISADLVRRWAPRPRPFYLQVDHFAPHWGPGDRTGRCPSGPVPAPLDEEAFLGATLPRGPSFNEPDISDKPEFMQSLEPLTGSQIGVLERFWGCALASLRSVDHGIRGLWRALGEAGAQRDTVIVFTSDNGYLLGEHRIGAEARGVPGDKMYPYEESIRVPLAIRLPPRLSSGRPQRRRTARPAVNIDLAPTILELTGARPCMRAGCRRLDGRSLVGELRRGRRNRVPPDRAVLLEIRREEPAIGLTCSYRGIRVGSRQVLIRHTRAKPEIDGRCADGEWIEHYELSADPDQLRNLHPAPAGSQRAAEQTRLLRRLELISRCSGSRSRGRPPRRGVRCP